MSVKVGVSMSAYGLGATLSSFFGQMVSETYGHLASILFSFGLSFVPIIIFGLFMPETMGDRLSCTEETTEQDYNDVQKELPYVELT